MTSLLEFNIETYFQKMQEYEIREFVKTQLTLPDKIDPADEMSWQHYLYSKLGSKKDTVEIKPQQIEEVVDRIMAMAKVLYGLHMVIIPSYRWINIFFPLLIYKIGYKLYFQ